MKVFIGMETSGTSRRAFAARGHTVLSCDTLPADDGADWPTGPDSGGHMQMDVFAALDWLKARGWWPDLALFHPSCTYLTISAAWAFNDPDFVRYPGVGYHQKVKPGTLVGAARREARAKAVDDVKRIWALPIERLGIENPIGSLSSLWRKPDQVIQPHWFGDDASKATCLWFRQLPPLTKTWPVSGRLVEWPQGSGKMVERWGNQTDSGQNKLSPSDDRWKERSKTYPGPAKAFASQWG